MTSKTFENVLKQSGRRLENNYMANEMMERHMMATSGKVEEKS
jgi:hypothetical protein